MKRPLFIALAAWACAFGANAQIVVDSLGRVGIGTETPLAFLDINGRGVANPIARFFQSCEKTGLRLYCYPHPSFTGNMKGIDIYGRVQNNSEYVGVNSYVLDWTDNLSRAAVGVSGMALRSKCNIGVLGQATTGDSLAFCAGIYGGLGGTGRVPSINIIGNYAGYFAGPAKVTGRLYATLYSPTSAPSTSSNSAQALSFSAKDEETVSDKLLSVQTIQFVREEETGRVKPSDSSAKLAKEMTLSEDAEMDDVVEEEMEAPQYETEMVKHYGLDGAQLKAAFPELVAEDSQGNYSVNYVEMVPLLLQSIRELSARVEELEGKKSGGVQRLNAKATSIESEGESTDIVRMSQNKPNPFSESSVIALCVPEGTKQAAIYVYDLSGKLVKSIPVDKRGETDITLYASDLQEGMFVYSLVTDGTVAATRRMMVVKN